MGKHEISHMKQHERALQDLQTRALLDQLVLDWPSLKNVERGDRLEPLLVAGCTAGGLARDLSCDRGTIRRARQIGALSPADRLMVERGANPDCFLRRQHHWGELVEDVCRLLRESLDGSVSEDLALNIVWYLCFYDAGMCFSYNLREEVFEEMGFRVRAKAGWIRSTWMPAKWWKTPPNEMNQQNRGVLRLAQDCEPQPEGPNDDSCDGEHVLVGLMKFIRKLENRTSLIDRGLDKARLICRQLDRNRASDLEIVGRAQTLGPEEFAIAMREHLRMKNSLHHRRLPLVA
jgi:hypothetical protein